MTSFLDHSLASRSQTHSDLNNASLTRQFREPAADLAIALSIASSFFDIPVPPRLAGESISDTWPHPASIMKYEPRGFWSLCVFIYLPLHINHHS